MREKKERVMDFLRTPNDEEEEIEALIWLTSLFRQLYARRNIIPNKKIIIDISRESRLFY